MEKLIFKQSPGTTAFVFAFVRGMYAYRLLISLAEKKTRLLALTETMRAALARPVVLLQHLLLLLVTLQ